MKSNIIIFLFLFLASCSEVEGKHAAQSKIIQNASNNSLQFFLILGLVGLLVVLFIGATLRSRARVARIQRIYKATRSQLHFWDKLDRQKLELSLVDDCLPDHWIFHLNPERTKIESIYFQNGLESNKIASDKEIMYDLLKKQLEQMKKKN